MPATDPDAELVADVEIEVHRAVLRELQTGGGLTLEQISGLTSDPRRPSEEAIALRRAVTRLRALRAGAHERAARMLSAGGVPRRVLDVGAGQAPWSLALASRSEAVEVVALDLPERMPELRTAVAKAGRTRQFAFAEVDFRSRWLRPSRPFELVVIANVCHLLDPREVQELLARAASVLDEQGTVAVVDQVLDDPPDWTTWAALYAVGAPHWGPGGSLYTTGQYETWLNGAGLGTTTSHGLCPPPPLMLLCGRR